MTYKEAYQTVKEGPWSKFFETQDLEQWMDTLDRDTKTIHPSPEDMFKVFELEPNEIKSCHFGTRPIL